MRPIVAFFAHNHLLTVAETYFTSLLDPFKSAHLPCSLEISRYSNLEALSKCTIPENVLEKLLTTMKSTLTLYLPSDYSLILELQTPYQMSHPWIPSFTLKTCSTVSADGEMSFDALSDAESPITLFVEESLSSSALEILGQRWRKVEMREFEDGKRRVRVELRGKDNMGRITVVKHAGQELDCVNRSLKDVLISIVTEDI